MNAVEYFAARLPNEAARRLAARPVSRFDRGEAHKHVDGGEARKLVVARWSDDLCGLLNAMSHDELAALAQRQARSPELRALLWERGAALEASGSDVGALQPKPV